MIFISASAAVFQQIDGSLETYSKEYFFLSQDVSCDYKFTMMLHIYKNLM